MCLLKIIKEFGQRMRWAYNADRLGPDILPTYLLMYSPTLGRRICEKKFLYFGKGAEVRHGAVVIGCSNISLGDYVYIRPNTILVASLAKITIENKALIASGVQMHVTNHEYKDVNRPIFDQGHQEGKDILIKSGAWVGANAVILAGITIGKNSVVAAGSVVNKNVPDYTIVAGVPAKIIKRII
ncbi:acyltransferase [Psychrobacillus sp. L3]|uniref:acyltransferase n=1 Tax=Psychrobacillus sp. L3 TaxID=3236891 RepID=UPI0036F1FEDE